MGRTEESKSLMVIGVKLEDQSKGEGEGEGEAGGEACWVEE